MSKFDKVREAAREVTEALENVGAAAQRAADAASRGSVASPGVPQPAIGPWHKVSDGLPPRGKAYLWENEGTYWADMHDDEDPARMAHKEHWAEIMEVRR